MRIIVVGDRPVYSCWFESTDWKKFGVNTKLNFDNVPQTAKDLCVDITKRIGFHWAAFDIARFNGDFYFFEFSSVFGFSYPRPLTERFGSPNAYVLRRQAEYIHDHLIKEKMGQ